MEALFQYRPVLRVQAIENAGWRKLLYLHAAQRLEDLRISGQWRICSVWRNGEARDVEIVDYH